MKHALALLLLSCALVAQDKPAAEAPKPAAVEPDFNKIADNLLAADAAEKMRNQKLLQTPINVRDSLIELINQLKIDASSKINSPLTVSKDQAYQTALATKYEADMKAKTEAQRLLLQALLELAKLPVDSPKQFHSSSVRRDLQRK
jgi:hypothetical protein